MSQTGEHRLRSVSGVLVLFLATACAHRPAVPPAQLAPDERTRLGTVGVRWAGPPPVLGYDRLPVSRREATMDGVTMGAQTVALFGGGILFVPFTAPIGGTLGALSVPSPAEKQAARQALDRAARGLVTGEALRDAVRHGAQARTTQRLVPLPSAATSLPRAEAPAAELPSWPEGIDTIVEITGRWVALTAVRTDGFAGVCCGRTDYGRNPALALQIAVDVHVVGRDRALLGGYGIDRTSTQRTFATWGRNDARAFRAAWAETVRALGQEIAERLFPTEDVLPQRS